MGKFEGLLKSRREMELQLFTEGGGEGGAGEGAGADEGAGAGQGTGEGAGAGEGGKGEGGKKPFATFPDEKSFWGRVNREAEKQKSEFLKELGVDNADALKAILKAEQDRKDAELSETEKLSKKLAALETEKLEALTKAESVARTAEAKLLAAELGVNPARINHFLKLADIGDVKVFKDGSVDSEALKGKLNTLLEELPEFKGVSAQQTPGKGGGDFGGSNNQKPALTVEQIKKMSSDEIAANIDEVRKVMALSK